MAMKVTIQVSGGTPKVMDDIDTVEEAKEAVGAEGYTAVVNGEPASDDEELSDYAFVALAKPVKAGL